jgi:hypothetical protein
MMRRFLVMLCGFCILAPLAQAAAAGAPSASVYQGRQLSLSLAQVITQINQLAPLSYPDPQTTRVFSSVPAKDIEKITASKTGAAVEFWSDDSLDGMARESAVNVSWADLCAHCVYVVNDPENGADYQVQAFTSGDFVIKNSYRDVDDSGHLAPVQDGDLANSFSFDNAGNLAKARHVADLLSTMIALAAPAAAPAPVAAQPAAAADPSGEVRLAVMDTPAGPTAPAGASSYFQGPFAVRVGPVQGGMSTVDVVNISSQTRRVSIAVVDCQNIAAGDCGGQFDGKLAPGMKLSFAIHHAAAAQTFAFQISATQKFLQSSEASDQPSAGTQTLAANN